MQLPSIKRKAGAQADNNSKFNFKAKPNLRQYVNEMSEDSFDQEI